MAWRPMTPEELASRPEARLGGSLLLVVICAATLAAAFVIAILLMMTLIVTGLAGRSVGSIFSAGPAGIGTLYSVPMVYLMFWAVIFTLLTLTRSSSAPGFAAGGLAGWLGVRLVISVIGQIWIVSRGSGDIGFIVQMLIPTLLNFLGEIMLVTGFWIYMRDGARPNAYYRRLIGA